jgi:hypothetical protein
VSSTWKQLALSAAVAWATAAGAAGAAAAVAVAGVASAGAVGGRRLLTEPAAVAAVMPALVWRGILAAL